MVLTTLKDPLGNGILDYWRNPSEETDIVVHSDIAEDDVIHLKQLFRSLDEMPEIEQKALELCSGKVLDVGAGSGCHSILLQNRGVDVHSIDISAGAVKVMNERGLKHAKQTNVLGYHKTDFDTILLLMNGIGIAGTLDGLRTLLTHLKTLLNPNGKILLDSSDLIYLFTEDDGSVWVDLNSSYYGEVNYQMEYKDTIGDWFPWLFIDFETLSSIAKKLDLKCELILEGEDFHFLAQLSLPQK